MHMVNRIQNLDLRRLSETEVTVCPSTFSLKSWINFANFQPNVSTVLQHKDPVQQYGEKCTRQFHLWILIGHDYTSKIHSPRMGNIVDSGIGLSYRPSSLCSLVDWYGGVNFIPAVRDYDFWLQVGKVSFKTRNGFSRWNVRGADRVFIKYEIYQLTQNLQPVHNSRLLTETPIFCKVSEMFDSLKAIGIQALSR
jgi:hypothetical protein